MLTLTRKVGESIRIGDDIVVVVKEIKGKQVRIGIDAPRDVYVCREELFLKIKQANLGALAVEPSSDPSGVSVMPDALTALSQAFLSRQLAHESAVSQANALSGEHPTRALDEIASLTELSVVKSQAEVKSQAKAQTRSQTTSQESTNADPKSRKTSPESDEG